MTAGTGVSSNDFAQILQDMQRTVAYQICTKTTDQITGDESSSFATASNVTLVFFTEDTRWLFDKEGLVEVGDAYVLAPTTTGIKRYDRFTIGGETYYIDKVINRYVLGTAMLDYGVCFLVA